MLDSYHADDDSLIFIKFIHFVNNDDENLPKIKLFNVKIFWLGCMSIVPFLWIKNKLRKLYLFNVIEIKVKPKMCMDL